MWSKTIRGSSGSCITLSRPAYLKTTCRLQAQNLWGETARVRLSPAALRRLAKACNEAADELEKQP